MSNDKQQQHLYNPTFKLCFLHPKYWLTWIGISMAALLAFIPATIRDRLANKLSSFVISRKDSTVIRRAKINLSFCFPNKSEEDRETILRKTFEKAAQYMLGYSELQVRSTQFNQDKGILIGEENLFPLLESDQRVIILALHTWAIDYPAVMLASRGYKVTNIMKTQENLVIDWLMHKQRMQYGGRIYHRDVGIKPFLRSIKEGYIGYWAADEDHGHKNSVFAPFFGTEKATLKGFGKLAKLTNAKIVPILPAYNEKLHKYEVFILPALENFPTGDEEQDARKMNQAIEELLTGREEHYMWNLPLLKTRPDGSKPYRKAK
ncbi:lauroyl-Kdo(2)-lipid IV(A) myristoyltransferase [Vibrio sp. RC27]